MGTTRGAITLLLCLTMWIGAAIAQTPATSPATTAPSTQSTATRVAVIPLDGMIDDFNRDAVIRRFKLAREAGATTIILEINTYGGLVTSGLDISRFLKQQTDLHTIAFVKEKAISAGAMIALACDEIVMQPSALLGDCAPIAMTSEGGAEAMGATERAKAESPILADFYDSAVTNGYDPLLVQSMVSLGRTVYWIENADGERQFVDEVNYKTLMAGGDWHDVRIPGISIPVDGPDTLLTVSTDQAIKLGLARSVAISPAALASERNYQIVVQLNPGTAERLVSFLSSYTVRGILTMVFMLSLYMAFSHPGTGLAETSAVVCLSVLLGVPMLTGYAQWWEILAVVVGIALIAVELFLIPGFGVTGITGVVLILYGLVATFVPVEPPEIPGFMPSLGGTWRGVMRGLYAIFGGLLGSLFLWFWLQRYLPRLPYFNRLILTTTASGDIMTEDSPPPPAQPIWPPIGTAGRAMTDLRPGGTAEFYDEILQDRRLVDVISDTGFVRSGTPVVVRDYHSGTIVVRAKPAAVEPPPASPEGSAT
jgi:membrane-bound serine protease (ClpP class)